MTLVSCDPPTQASKKTVPIAYDGNCLSRRVRARKSVNALVGGYRNVDDWQTEQNRRTVLPSDIWRTEEQVGCLRAAALSLLSSISPT